MEMEMQMEVLKGKAKRGGKRSRMNSGTAAMVERKEVERERRRQMKQLCAKLASLIPKENYSSTDAMTQLSSLDEAAKYITKLKERVDELRQRKNSADAMATLRSTYGVSTPTTTTTTTTSCRAGSSVLEAEKGASALVVEVRQHDDSSMDVVLICNADRPVKLHEVVTILEEEGAEIVSANHSVAGSKIFYIIHSRAFSSRIGIEVSRVAERLRALELLASPPSWATEGNPSSRRRHPSSTPPPPPSSPEATTGKPSAPPMKGTAGSQRLAAMAVEGSAWWQESGGAGQPLAPRLGGAASLRRHRGGGLVGCDLRRQDPRAAAPDMEAAASHPPGVAGQVVALRSGSRGGGSRDPALRFVAGGMWRLELSPASTVLDAGDLQPFRACESEARAVAPVGGVTDFAVGGDPAGGGYGITRLPVKTVPYGRRWRRLGVVTLSKASLLQSSSSRPGCSGGNPRSGSPGSDDGVALRRSPSWWHRFWSGRWLQGL